MRIAVYTCITGGYDSLSVVPRGQSPDIDFICFTDDPTMTHTEGNWSVRPIPPELAMLPKVKQQRVVKARPHAYLGDYGATLWVDGNITPICDVAKFISGYGLDGAAIWTRRHPLRDCAYAEASAVVKARRDSAKTVDAQMARYREGGFPEHFGLHETGILLRTNADPKVREFGNLWAKEILDGSHRDQLSFDWCRWRLGLEVGALKVGSLVKDPNSRWRRHRT